MHAAAAPSGFTVGTTVLTKLAGKAAYDDANTGWYFDPADRVGTLWIKAGNHAVSSAFNVTATGLTLPTGTAETTNGPIPQANWRVVSADSQETAAENGAAANAVDGSSGTLWHTRLSTTATPLPHEIRIDLGARYGVGPTWLPRRDGGVNGRIGAYESYVSDSASTWGSPVATGTFADTPTAIPVNFPAKSGRYLRLRVLSEAGNCGPWTGAAELTATGVSAPSP
ncbi:discoidin domain-containing protein [Kitasatospora sp. NPDC059795]|uniref:discoidin domain-containing protein n=1 Tax=Kitasatospora sp. NPDC059795 TaxID=3346949 RepID=UPI003656BEE0